MIAVDSSVLIATAFDEPGAAAFADGLLSIRCKIAWPTILETRMVMERRGSPSALEFLAGWIERGNVSCLPFDGALYVQAVSAFRRFGKGSGHGAGLNFGDCMAYAVAKVHDVPLLYKGGDFRLTDIRPALP